MKMIKLSSFHWRIQTEKILFHENKLKIFDNHVLYNELMAHINLCKNFCQAFSVFGRNSSEITTGQARLIQNLLSARLSFELSGNSKGTMSCNSNFSINPMLLDLPGIALPEWFACYTMSGPLMYEMIVILDQSEAIVMMSYLDWVRYSIQTHSYMTPSSTCSKMLQFTWKQWLT